MTNQEILSKAIRKAIGEGWNLPELSPIQGFTIIEPISSYQVLIEFITDLPKSFENVGAEKAVRLNYQAIIFNHDFAKVLWGEELVTNLENKYDLLREAVYVTSDYPSNYDFDYPLWIWHLQQMVIAEDPIKYLGDNI